MRCQLALTSGSQQDQAQNTGITVIRGHQTEPENIQNTISRSRTNFFSYKTMAKVGSISLLLAVVIIIVLGILAESFTSAQKSKPKVVVKRRKTVTTTTLPPPTDSPLEINAELLPQVQRSVDGQLFLYPVTGSSILDENQSSGSNPVERSNSGNYRSIEPNTENSLAAAGVSKACPAICEPEKCPSTAACHTGLVQDRCSCCNVCAVGEGTRCYNLTEPLGTIGPGDGICGPGMICSTRMDLEPDEPFEALCECRNKQSVCGSDNVTYSSECKLREASHLKRNLTIASWSSCVSAPWITTAMENVTGAIGRDLSVSCEFRSFPAAIIHWEFSPDGSSEHIVLPGDDSSIIQTNRGGPEDMMTTSWVQIISVTPKHQGIYYCIAKNSEGMSHSYASVSVYSEAKI